MDWARRLSNRKTRQEAFKVWDLALLVLDIEGTCNFYNFSILTQLQQPWYWLLFPACSSFSTTSINTLRPIQNGRHFADDIFKCISLNENVWISIEISLKFVCKGSINNIPALVQIMAWRRPGDKPLSGPMMVRLPTHICVTRPQWVNIHSKGIFYRAWMITCKYNLQLMWLVIHVLPIISFNITRL